MRTSSTCADDSAARSAASGAPTFHRFCRQAFVMRQEPGRRMHSTPSRNRDVYKRQLNGYYDSLKALLNEMICKGLSSAQRLSLIHI